MTKKTKQVPSNRVRIGHLQAGDVIRVTNDLEIVDLSPAPHRLDAGHQLVNVQVMPLNGPFSEKAVTTIVIADGNQSVQAVRLVDDNVKVSFLHRLLVWFRLAKPSRSRRLQQKQPAPDILIGPRNNREDVEDRNETFTGANYT